MKIIKKWDIIIFCFVITIAIILLCVFTLVFLNNGKEVVVRVNGNEYARLPIDKNCELLIKSKNGTNTLIIKDGKAYVESASCPKQICVNHGKVSELSPIVCNYNQVSITLE